MKKILVIGIITLFSTVVWAQKTPDTASVMATINKVNAYWQNNNAAECRAFWDHAAYQTGNMEAYRITGNTSYRQYAEKWANFNGWKGAQSNDKEKWKYSYGESAEYVLFGDWHICFQTYIDLYQLDPQEYKIARAREVMEYQMSTPKNDYWWWADGLYMVMPVMTKMHQITGDKRYTDKLFSYFKYADSVMFDSEEKLYYRDAKYLYPKHKSINGRKDFWSRGNGWVLAGLAKVLADIPKIDEHILVYQNRFKQLADAVVNSQQKEGYWTRSMLDSAHAPGPETSGTAFFCYGLLWGINNGYLKGNAYKKAAYKAFEYLNNTALQANGQVGYIQPIGEKAIPGQVVDRNSTADFGVGAFLLASCEMYRYLKNVQVHK
ncbi:glycoside hydrolase family 88 protein [Pedobacter sp. AW1-32]|uniref:glycoside hydrolase family 88/105 protein n=1 Tax=Pedobacter sp. AW1-32 TaxID=3383026 RepID=UPI003FEE0560